MTAVSADTDFPVCYTPFQDLAHALGRPTARARVRRDPEDFVVEEVLGFEPDGEGTHGWLHVRKRGLNTEAVARQIASLAGARPADVGYSGLKDRNAVTTQWFSVNLAGRPEPDWSSADSPQLETLEVTRSRRKLRRGAHHGNRFRLVLRDMEGDAADLSARLARVGTFGVPNYFGDQRFGRDAGNIRRAWAMFSGANATASRHKRGLYLSAARALLFNRVLARRVVDGTWDQGLPGEVMMLDGTHSVFVAERVDEALLQRLAARDIHPTGPLWGRSESMATGAAAAVERAALAGCEAWCKGLEAAELKQARRSLRLVVRALEWSQPDPQTVQLAFFLPSGSFATAVLRELICPKG